MDGEVSYTTVRATPDGRLTRKEAAKYLGLAENTLANWKSRGEGPKPMRLGRRVFYRLTDLQAFIRTSGGRA